MHKAIPFFFLAVFLSFASPAYAQTAVSRDRVTLPREATVDENYFATGEDVVISGTVNGDAYAAGGNMVMDGTVNGDLIIAGGQMNIDGLVTGDLRASGGQINITGEVRGNITALGGSVTVARGAVVGGSLTAGTGQLSVLAPIGRGITVGAGSATIGGPVGGNVLAAVERLRLTTNANIQGNLNYYSSRELDLVPGAQIGGRVNHTRTADKSEDRDTKGEKLAASFKLMYKMLSALSALVLGWVFVSLFPVFSRQTIRAVETRTGPVLGTGLLILFLVPVFAVILLMTVVGMPFFLMLMAAYFVYIYASKIFFALFVGKKIADWMNGSHALFAYLFTGLVAWLLLTSLPWVGWIFSFASLLIGTGTLFYTKRRFASALRERNLI